MRWKFVTYFLYFICQMLNGNFVNIFELRNCEETTRTA